MDFLFFYSQKTFFLSSFSFFSKISLNYNFSLLNCFFKRSSMILDNFAFSLCPSNNFFLFFSARERKSSLFILNMRHFEARNFNEGDRRRIPHTPHNRRRILFTLTEAMHSTKVRNILSLSLTAPGS